LGSKTRDSAPLPFSKNPTMDLELEWQPLLWIQLNKVKLS